jgi:hypothetical protein
MSNLHDPNRDVQIKMRFNKAEADALATLAESKGISLAAVIRELLHTAVRNPDKRDTCKSTKA